MRAGTLREMADTLRRAYRAEAVWLFGSVADGTADIGSDLDLLVISPTQEPFFRRMATVRRLLRPFRGEFPVSPIVLTPEEFQGRLAAGDQFIRSIASRGVQL